MSVDASTLKNLIASELVNLTDQRIIDHIRAHLVEPSPERRDWDYGEPGKQYLCWIVFRHAHSNLGIAYCEHGFGPRSPWGMLSIGGEGNPRSMGQDSAWYTTFVETYFNSSASSELPIWRVFKEDRTGRCIAVSGEGTWEDTWARVKELPASDPANFYSCGNDVEYPRE